MASIEPYKNKNQVYPMSLFRKSAFTAILLLSVNGAANAATNADDLLNQIDADIAAKRLGAPAGNNAIEKIWQFKDNAPYDQRINSRAFTVGEFYVGLANKAIAAKKYAEAQDHLDKAWDIASLTPGLSKAQDNLDAATGKPSVATIQARPVSQPAPAAPKADNSAELAAAAKKAENDAKVLAAKKADDEARAQALAAKKAAEDEKAKALAAKKADESKSAAAKKDEEKAKALAAKKAAEDEKARKLAEAKALQEELAAKKAEQAQLQAAARKAQEEKRVAAEKMAALAASSAGADDEEDMPADAPKETEASIAKFDLTASSVTNRSTAEIRGQLEPICQEIIDNDASVVLHTPNLQDARWLVVRLTLCVRRIDKDFRLRHSYDIGGDNQPSVSLHAGRNVSLVKKARQ